ncbi:MAG: hypothetical protein AAGJ91_14400 [Pseudomonadota bacterium]
MPSPPKYVVGPEPSPLDLALVETLERCETTILGHILYWGAMDTGIRANKSFGPRIAGRALRVQIPGPCPVMLH